MEAGDHGGAGLVGVDLDVVADGVAGPEADDGFGGETFFGDDLREEFLRVGEEFLRFDADDDVVEDLRKAAVEFPGAEEGRPVDIRDDVA